MVNWKPTLLKFIASLISPYIFFRWIFRPVTLGDEMWAFLYQSGNGAFGWDTPLVYWLAIILIVGGVYSIWSLIQKRDGMVDK